MSRLEGLPRESLFSLKTRFAKLHLSKPQGFWNNLVWTDETKVEIFVHKKRAQCLGKTKHSISAQTSHIISYTLSARFCRAELGLFCNHWSRALCCHWMMRGHLSDSYRTMIPKIMTAVQFIIPSGINNNNLLKVILSCFNQSNTMSQWSQIWTMWFYCISWIFLLSL